MLHWMCLSVSRRQTGQRNGSVEIPEQEIGIGSVDFSSRLRGGKAQPKEHQDGHGISQGSGTVPRDISEYSSGISLSLRATPTFLADVPLARALCRCLLTNT